MTPEEYIKNAIHGELDQPDTLLHDELMRRYIKPQYLKLERDLYRSKWFDYRLLDPVQATMVYISYYEPVYAEQVQKYATSEEALYRKPITLEKVMNAILEDNPTPAAKSNFSSLFRGRAVADALGMPYDLFLRTSFDVRMRAWQNNRLPRPQQLYGEAFMDRIIQEWEKHKDQVRLQARHPAYKGENYIGLEIQDDYREFLLEQGHRQVISNNRMWQYAEDGYLTSDLVERFIVERSERIRHPSVN